MQPITNGMEVTYELPDIKVKLTVKVVLDQDGLVITLPSDTITEEGGYHLASVQMYPFLGAVRGASVPGYLFIPDGSGALIRFTDNHTLYDEPYVGKIYGNDIGVNGFEYSDSMTGYPVFGIVQGVKQNALMGVVEDGKMNADIVAYPSGVNTNFYWVSPRFNIRYGYYQPTSKTMGGINMYTKNKTEGDKQVRYELLSGNQADYAGMAQAYRGYLQEKGMLPEKADSASSTQEDIPLRVDILGGDIEKGVLKNHVIKMTSFEDAQFILTDLQKAGVTNLKAVLKGWSKDGANGAQPSAPGYADVLGGQDGLRKLREYTKQHGIDLYLYTDYSRMIDGSPRVNPRRDAVRMITSSLVNYHYVSRYVSDLFRDLDGYLLSPATAFQLAKEDFQSFHEDGIEDVAIGSTGSLLYSDYHKGLIFNRTTAAQQYGKIGDEAAKQSLHLALFGPNDYMLKYTESYFDMPLYSSQYMYETDTVPFVPMVLHGMIDYYAGYSNYNADPALDLLRMIDYGANPSFIVTKEPSWKMQNTPSSELFTTEYNDWSAEMKQQYAKVNAALKPVQHAFMIGRTVVSHGIVKVSYDNGVNVWVNYTGSDYEDGKVTVKARDFAVTGGEQS
nr:DUF5696 domain-containing protein [Paenibacillus sediminis]